MGESNYKKILLDTYRQDGLSLDAYEFNGFEDKPNELELILSSRKNADKTTARLIMGQYGSALIQEWPNKEEAQKEYEGLLDQFKKGGKLTRDSSGEIEIGLYE